MPRALIIRLETTTEPDNWRCSWVTVENGRVVSNLMRGSLQDAHTLVAHAQQVIVLVPAEDILITTVSLPGGNRKRLLQAAPYAVEDQLIDDIAELHFALGNVEIDNRYALAVVRHERMRAWVKYLHEAGIRPDVLVPDALALPVAAGSLYLDAQRALLRRDAQVAVAIESDMLAWLLKSLNPSPALQVYTPTGLTEAEARQLLGDEATVEDVHQLNTDLTHWLAPNVEKDVNLNLLQGEYGRQRKLDRDQLRPWLPAAVMLVVWLVWQFGVGIVEYIHLSQQMKSNTAEMIRIYRTAFPQAQKVIKPYEQMQQQLRELQHRGGKGQDNFQAMLVGASGILKSTQSIQINSLRFHDGRMELELEVPDLQVLDGLKAKLVQQGGWTVEIQSASSKNNKVQGRLSIRGQGV